MNAFAQTPACVRREHHPAAGRLLALVAGMLALVAIGARPAGAADDGTPVVASLEDADYDPWAPFNERMFSFNHGILDRFVVKPVAVVWDKICPNPVKRGVGRMIDNLQMPRRVVNNALQGRFLGAGTEVGRFVVNTTAGIGGMFDVATPLHLARSDADAGETLGVWGVGPGPFLVLPFLAPLTIRDGVGRAVDTVLDPLWLVPFFGGTVVNLVNTVNERSLHLRLFADVEESSLDLYTSVRNGYLQRRERAVATRHEDLVRVVRTLFGTPAPAVMRASDDIGGSSVSGGGG
jgi:phospholipid-binding lipoprotein MlaA